MTSALLHVYAFGCWLRHGFTLWDRLRGHTARTLFHCSLVLGCCYLIWFGGLHTAPWCWAVLCCGAHFAHAPCLLRWVAVTHTHLPLHPTTTTLPPHYPYPIGSLGHHYPSARGRLRRRFTAHTPRAALPRAYHGRAATTFCLTYRLPTCMLFKHLATDSRLSPATPDLPHSQFPTPGSAPHPT